MAYHEITLALGMIGLLVVASGSENHTAVWTYLILLSFAVACFAERMIAAKTPALDMQFTLLTALALLEHWLMVLPLPDAKLWRWMLPAAKRLPDPK